MAKNPTPSGNPKVTDLGNPSGRLGGDATLVVHPDAPSAIEGPPVPSSPYGATNAQPAQSGNVTKPAK